MWAWMLVAPTNLFHEIVVESWVLGQNYVQDNSKPCHNTLIPKYFFLTSLPLVLHGCYNVNTQPIHLCHQLLHAQLKWNNKSKEALLISILICKSNNVLHKCWGHWFNWPWNNLQLAHLQAHHFVKDCIVSYFIYYLTTFHPHPLFGPTSMFMTSYNVNYFPILANKH
jgi:hypothetical protein